MTLAPIAWKSSGRLLSLALVSSVALSTGATYAAPRQAMLAPVAQTWLTVDPPLLCRTWVSPSEFARHCTAHWHLDAQRRPFSDDPAWVPVDSTLAGFDDAGVAARLPLAYTRPIKRLASTKAAPSRHLIASGTYSASGPYGLWTPPPGYHAYAMSDYAGDPNAAEFGFCTWWAQYKRQDEQLITLGNAGQWAANARSQGMSVGSAPRLGATVVFAPGVEGASSQGHVAHVEAVYGGGWFLISEMNMAWNGGGWGRVSFRYALAAPGVSFIY